MNTPYILSFISTLDNFKFFFFLTSPEDVLIDFRERGRAGQRDREKNIDVREKYQSVASRRRPNQGLGRRTKMAA